MKLLNHDVEPEDIPLLFLCEKGTAYITKVTAWQFNSPTADKTLQQGGNAGDEENAAHDLRHGNPVMTDTQH